MRRKPLAAVLALLSAALVLGGNALLDAGWGSALRSIADRVLPNPEIAMWALSGRGTRGCAQGSGPLSAAQVQCRREFQEVEHGEDTGSG